MGDTSGDCRLQWREVRSSLLWKESVRLLVLILPQRRKGSKEREEYPSCIFAPWRKERKERHVIASEAKQSPYAHFMNIKFFLLRDKSMGDCFASLAMTCSSLRSLRGGRRPTLRPLRYSLKNPPKKSGTNSHIGTLAYLHIKPYSRFIHTISRFNILH